MGLLGALYRPSSNLAAGLSGSFYGSLPLNGGFKYRSADDDDDDNYRKAKQKSSWIVDAHMHYYLWDTSAFFIGGGLSYRGAEYSWTERTNAYTATNKTYTPVDYRDRAVYLRLPIGWDWIWSNGFTLSLDIGPGVRISHTSSYPTPGDNVDTSRRADYAQDVEHRNLAIGGAGLIGYSF